MHFAFIMRGGPLPPTHLVSAPPVAAVAADCAVAMLFLEMLVAAVVVVAVAVRP